MPLASTRAPSSEASLVSVWKEGLGVLDSEAQSLLCHHGCRVVWISCFLKKAQNDINQSPMLRTPLHLRKATPAHGLGWGLSGANLGLIWATVKEIRYRNS